MSMLLSAKADRFLLPSIYSVYPFFRTVTASSQTQIPRRSLITEQRILLILTYARCRRLFILQAEDAEVPGGDWDEILRNERINRKILRSYLSSLMTAMVVKNVAVYEAAKQTRAVLLYWRLPEEWADVLHSWRLVSSTPHPFYEISDPPVPSPLSGIPMSLLRRAITILTRSNRAQIIGVADGEGVRFFAATKLLHSY
ncbi:hypothetical protein M405DRAFT_876515 [Rhizopogon salebrosus TDB-379]|nr:hypothetical protein M405DRAFT_876515 [Rhizopogon salebrosus TDB-379]